MRTRYVDIDDRMEDLADRLRADPELGEDFLSKYELSWLYHENALEGVVYSGQELATALANAPARRRHLRQRAAGDPEPQDRASTSSARRRAAKKLKLNLTLGEAALRDARRRASTANAGGVPQGHAAAPGVLPRDRPAGEDPAAPAEAARRLRHGRVPQRSPDPAGGPAAPRLHAGLPVHATTPAGWPGCSRTSSCSTPATGSRASSTPPIGSGTTSRSGCPRRRCATSPSRRSTTRSRRPRSSSPRRRHGRARAAAAPPEQAWALSCSPGWGAPSGRSRLGGHTVGAVRPPCARPVRRPSLRHLYGFPRNTGPTQQAWRGEGRLLYRSRPHAARRTRRDRRRRLDRVRPGRGGRRGLRPNLHPQRTGLGGEAARGRRGEPVQAARRGDEEAGGGPLVVPHQLRFPGSRHPAEELGRPRRRARPVRAARHPRAHLPPWQPRLTRRRGSRWWPRR